LEQELRNNISELEEQLVEKNKVTVSFNFYWLLCWHEVGYLCIIALSFFTCSIIFIAL
jgi:hypothetical protein